ncbi:MAG TPA: lipid-A-disaccharide synthase [Pseudolabrys sp.]|nr:lipid-A-disaccharide synthase [Pseudolabrys sp.]
MSPHVFLVAGEESGDRLGAALIAAIRRQTQGRAQFSCVGGALMAAEGVPSLFPLGDLAVIGFSAIPASLPKIFRRIREAADAVIAAKPDVLVIIDSPEFTHRVARRVRARTRDIPIVDYVCPSVWAWRPGRARAMRKYVDHVLALFPFEPKIMGELGGPPCSYVGHPLIEHLSELRPNDLEKRLRLADPPLLLVLPGSRTGEIRRMAPVFGSAIVSVAEQSGPIEVVVPAVPRLAGAVRAAVASWRVPARVITDAGEKYEALRTARAALTKSGTSTLELALAGVPMVAAYKVSFVEAAAARALLTVPSVILANLVLEEIVVPEFLQRDCTTENLAKALLPLLADTTQRRLQINAFARLDTVLEIGKSIPSDRAATYVLDYVGRPSQPRHEIVAPAAP